MNKHSIFKMLDLTDEEYSILYSENKNFFFQTYNWFYFKNDKKHLNDAEYVMYGDNYGDIYKSFNPDIGNGAVVLYSDIEINENFRKVLNETEDGIICFDLENSALSGELTILKRKGIEFGIGLLIHNLTGEMDLPFSKNGAVTYDEAKLEEGTIPYMVENNMFVQFLPDEISKLIGIDKSRYEKVEDQSKNLLFMETESIKNYPLSEDFSK